MDENSLVGIVVGLLLAYSILACYLDIRFREVPEHFWVMLCTIGIPITVVLYVLGYYPWYMIFPAVGAIIAYTLLFLVNVYQGADFVFLILISASFVKNPINGHILIPLSFGIFLVASVLCFAMLYQFIPPVQKYLTSKDLPGFPMMLPITMALWLTVVLA